jgi:hypothetical protein
LSVLYKHVYICMFIIPYPHMPYHPYTLTHTYLPLPLHEYIFNRASRKILRWCKMWCMYIYVCIYTFVRIYTYIYVFIRIYMFLFTYMYIFIYIHIHIYVFVYRWLEQYSSGYTRRLLCPSPR